MTQTVSGFTVPAGSDPVSSIDDTLVTFAGEVRAAITAATEIPTQTGNAGKFLTTDGTNSSWGTPDAVAKTLIDAKGDLIVGSADNTPARLAVGTNGQILIADSTQAGGVKWGSLAAGGGLAFIAGTSVTNAAALSVNNCFTSTYQNYRIVGRIKAISGSTTAYLRLRAGGTDNTSSVYYSLYRYEQINGADFASIKNSGTNAGWIINSSNAVGYIEFSIDVYAPQMSLETQFSGTNTQKFSTSIYTAFNGGVFDATTAFDGFSIYNSGQNITAEIRVFGYQNS